MSCNILLLIFLILLFFIKVSNSSADSDTFDNNTTSKEEVLISLALSIHFFVKKYLSPTFLKFQFVDQFLAQSTQFSDKAFKSSSVNHSLSLVQNQVFDKIVSNLSFYQCTYILVLSTRDICDFHHPR